MQKRITTSLYEPIFAPTESRVPVPKGQSKIAQHFNACHDPQLLQGFVSYAYDINYSSSMICRFAQASLRDAGACGRLPRGLKSTATIVASLRDACRCWLPSSCRPAARERQRIPGIFLLIWAAKKGNSCQAQEDVGNDKPHYARATLNVVEQDAARA